MCLLLLQNAAYVYVFTVVAVCAIESRVSCEALERLFSYFCAKRMCW